MNAFHVGAIGPLTVIVRRQPMFGIDTLLLQPGDGHVVWNGIPFFHIARKRVEDRVGQGAGRIRVDCRNRTTAPFSSVLGRGTTG